MNRRFARLFEALFVLVVLAGCPPSAPATQPADAAVESTPLPAHFPPDAPLDVPADNATRACLKLRALGCPLGDAGNCAATFRLPARFGIDPECVLKSQSPAELHACRVTCQP